MDRTTENAKTNENKTAPEQTPYERARDYFLGRSVEPAKSVPDLLAENRKTAYELAEHIMLGVSGIADYFGIDMLDLVMHAMPEITPSIEVDGVREMAAARTYLDLRGSLSLAEICEGTHAYPAPTLRCVAKEIQRRERKNRVLQKDPFLSRLLFSDEELKQGYGGNAEAVDEEESADDVLTGEEGMKDETPEKE